MSLQKITKMVVAIFATTIFSLGLFAQKGESIFVGGIRASLTMSQISGDDLGGFHQVGIGLAPTVHFPISKDEKWNFMMELQFDTKGSRTPTRVNEDGSMVQKYVLNLWYVGASTLFTWNPFKGIIIEAGPQFNVLVYSRERNNFGTMENREPFRRFELSGAVGIGYLFKEHYVLSLRFTNSIIPVRVEKVPKKQFNCGLAINFHYRF